MNGSPPYCIVCSMGAVIVLQYPIFEKETIVGKATLEREGLYCRLYCYYEAKNLRNCRLICCNTEKILDIGIGVPHESKWEIKGFFPWRNLPENDMRFYLVSETANNDRRQKLKTGEPVKRLSQIVRGKLCNCEDGVYIVEANLS